MKDIQFDKPETTRETTWLVWTHEVTGNPATRSHATDGYHAIRTLCGVIIGSLRAHAGLTVPHCQKCERVARNGVTLRSFYNDGKESLSPAIKKLLFAQPQKL